MHSFPFSASHIISKMLSEQGLKPYNCSELEAAYGILSCSLVDTSSVQDAFWGFYYFWLSGFFCSVLPFILCCFFIYSPALQFFLPRLVIYIFSLGMSVLLGAVFVNFSRWLGSFFFFFKSVDTDLSAMFWGELREFTILILAPKFKSSYSNYFAQASNYYWVGLLRSVTFLPALCESKGWPLPHKARGAKTSHCEWNEAH